MINVGSDRVFYKSAFVLKSFNLSCQNTIFHVNLIPVQAK